MVGDELKTKNLSLKEQTLYVFLILNIIFSSIHNFRAKMHGHPIVNWQ